MTPSPAKIVIAIVIAAAYLTKFYFLSRRLQGSARVAYVYAAVLTAIVGFFYFLGSVVDDYTHAIDIAKAMLGIIAAGCVFYEQHRAGMRRPIAERWKRFVGITLGVAAIITYFNAFKFGYPKYYHRWDQYHYYMGAKYFREMGYDGLYKCGVIAQDEIGAVDEQNHDKPELRVRLDMSKEVRHADKKIRNLGGDNLLIPVTDVLAHPEECKAHFTPARWEEYKNDIKFFRISSDKQYWEDMQKDHGYNPPPVWTVAGYYLASAFPAGHQIYGFNWLQCLAGLDLVYIAGMFVALYWAFGWRVFAVGAILWGCQASAPFLWTGGAFLRQDWIFYLVLAACAARKRWFVLAGASMVYAGLLRVFPGLTVIGWLGVAGFYVARHRRLAPHHQRMLLGGVLAAAVLIPLSVHVAGRDSYKQFYQHTLQVHDRTPLTNHMGLRVMLSHGVFGGADSGRMKYTKDVKLTDPFEVWKRMRNERYDRYKYVGWAVIAASLALFLFVIRRIKSMWVAQALAQVFIILLSQLTCYYYSFIILAAPLTRVRRNLEAPIFGFVALTQFVFMAFFSNDDRYTALTLITLIFCLGLLCALMPQEDRNRIARRLGLGKPREN